MENSFNIANNENEQMACIWDVISDSSVMPTVRAVVKPEYFTEPAYRKAWEGICSLWDSGRTIDLVVASEVVPSETLTNLLSKCGSIFTTEMSALDHASALRKAYISRLAAIRAFQLLQKAQSGADEEELLSMTNGLSEDIIGNINTEDGVYSTKESVNRLANALEKEQKKRQEGKTSFITTGFSSIDSIFGGGLEPGDFVALAARPGVGKTSLGLQMARAAAASGKKVLYFSLEMTDIELTKKSMFAVGGLENYMMLNYDIDWGRFDQAASVLCTQDIDVDYKTFKLDEIIMKAKIANSRGKCDIVFIDHVGLIRMADNMSIYAAMTEKTAKLKNLALTSEMTVVGLFQLNRDVAKTGKAPMPHDLRDSGSIEQDVDKILMAHNPLDDNGEMIMPRTVELYVRKNRGGIIRNKPVVLIPNSTYSQFTEEQF